MYKQAFLYLLTGFLIGIGIMYCSYKPKPLIEHITVTDTIYKDRIEYKTKVKRVEMHDTVITLMVDTVTITDTIYIPIEYKQYTDTFNTDTTELSLKVSYSGYRASIDTVAYNLTYYSKEQPIKKKKEHFGQHIGIGVYGGYGGTIINSQFYAAPSVGVCIHYGWGYNW